MIVRTHDSAYEVRESEKKFRKLPRSRPSRLTWSSYDRLGPIVPGQPARFFVVDEERGRVLHYRVITTSPVVEVLTKTA